MVGASARHARGGSEERLRAGGTQQSGGRIGGSVGCLRRHCQASTGPARAITRAAQQHTSITGPRGTAAA